jgi:hypothetical protein
VLERRPFWEQLMLGRVADPRAEREEKVLRYIVHRLNEEVHFHAYFHAHFHDVLQEPYVRRNCTQEEIDEIVRNPELVHARREHTEEFFHSGKLDPKRRLRV